MERKRLLLVDDDSDLAELLAEQLQIVGEFDTELAHCARAALEAVFKSRFDLLLLDVGLPDMDGRDLCRLMRRQGIKVPIVMLSGLQSDADVVRGLDAGADDYIVKAIKFKSLLTRLQSHLR
ncbi:MAG: response regulator [Alphaproteobacteria bacterium]|nr:response regulator [Alphaproteobacteria bacterium]